VPISIKETPETDDIKHMHFIENKKFAEMFDMEVEGLKNQEEFCYFEPKPYDVFNDQTLEGCLRQFAKVETLNDKNNLYFCEKCTEDKYGKSKVF
jgi:hypothetical protein